MSSFIEFVDMMLDSWIRKRRSEWNPDVGLHGEVGVELKSGCAQKMESCKKCTAGLRHPEQIPPRDNFGLFPIADKKERKLEDNEMLYILYVDIPITLRDHVRRVKREKGQKNPARSIVLYFLRAMSKAFRNVPLITAFVKQRNENHHTPYARSCASQQSTPRNACQRKSTHVTSIS